MEDQTPGLRVIQYSVCTRLLRSFGADRDPSPNTVGWIRLWNGDMVAELIREAKFSFQ